MSWQYLESPFDIKERCIRLDGVNDYIDIPGSSFYNVSTVPFTFIMRVLWLGGGAGTTTFATSLLRKNAAGGITKRFVINIINNSTFQFVLVDNGNTPFTFTLPISYFLQDGFTTVVITREGTNSVTNSDIANWPNSVRNPSNYHAYINGASIAWASKPVGMVPEDVDNPGTFTLGAGANFGTLLTGYLDKFGVYNRVLTAEEITAIETGYIPSEGAKGFWGFDGSMVDYSSVSNNATLINNTLSDLYVYPRINCILVFNYNATATKTWASPEALRVTSIVRFGGTTTVLYSLDNTTFTPLTFTNDVATVSINLIQGQLVWFRATTSGNYKGSIQINF